MSSARSANARIGNSMFDCPEHSHTSPTSTSCAATLTATPSRVFTVRSYGPPAGWGGRVARKRPSAPVVVVVCAGPSVISSGVPGAARPNTFAGRSRCTTM